MSTRANIVVQDECDRLILYRHSDGYPEGALPLLKRFMQFVADRKIRDNVGQASGWLILMGAREYDHAYIDGKPVKKPDITVPFSEDETTGWKCGCIEPSTCMADDAEFTYVLHLTKRTIRVHAGNSEQSKVVKMLDFAKRIVKARTKRGHLDVRALLMAGRTEAASPAVSTSVGASEGVVG